MASGTLLYAQSGGVTAVINATAAAVIQTARARKVKVLAARNGILGALREELIDTSKESAAAIRALAHTPGGAFGSCRVKLKSLDAGPRAATSACSTCSGPRRALVPLQRRQRFGRHRAEGLAAGGGIRLPADLHRRAEDGRQRPGRHRLLPGLRLGGEVHRGVGARGRARRRGDGRHLDQGVRLRSDGPPRRLAGRGRGPGRRRAPTRRRTSSCSRSARTTKPTSSPR